MTEMAATILAPRRALRWRGVGAALATLFLVAACSTPQPIRGGYDRTGMASWYGVKFHGRTTANGQSYNMYAATAAHRSLRFGTKVRVTNLANGRSTVLTINDRGPFVKGRIIDVSWAAARELGFLESGVARVRIQAVQS